MRNKDGTFAKGNSLGGRPKGSRNKLAENFLEDVWREWKERGQQALTDLTGEKLVDTALRVLPRESMLNVTGSIDHNQLKTVQISMIGLDPIEPAAIEHGEVPRVIEQVEVDDGERPDTPRH